MVNEQVKSRKRVADHGEVFTSEREVNAMLDLVKQETERIDSRFLDIDLENNRILVKFNDGEKMFIFPQAFEKGFLKPQK